MRKYLLNHRSGHTNPLFFNFISHNTILPQIILFLSRTMLIFSYILSAKTNTSFSINLKLKEIMYLNVSNGRQCYLPRTKKIRNLAIILMRCRGILSHPVFKAKTRCSSYVCPGSSCHTYGQNVSTEYQCLYYIVSYYKKLLQVQKGLNSGMDPILPQAVDRGFRTPRRNLHQCTPHPLSSRT